MGSGGWRGGERFSEIGHFDKDFVKNTRKRGLAGKQVGVISPGYPQKYILHFAILKFNPKMDTIRALLLKISTLLSIFKKSGGRLPSLP